MYSLFTIGKRFLSPFDELFDELFRLPVPLPLSFQFNHPFKVDVQETKDEYVIEADLPGVKKEDIDVTIADEILHLTAKTGSGKVNKDKDARYLVRERAQSTYSREFYLPGIVSEKVQAIFNDGLLLIKLPKSKEGTKNVSIKIE